MVDGERWLVRVLVTRDPNVDDVPALWDWGDGATVLRCELVGVDPIQPEALEVGP